jgi:hypothetical protein
LPQPGASHGASHGLKNAPFRENLRSASTRAGVKMDDESGSLSKRFKALGFNVDKNSYNQQSATKSKQPTGLKCQTTIRQRRARRGDK